MDYDRAAVNGEENSMSECPDDRLSPRLKIVNTFEDNVLVLTKNFFNYLYMWQQLIMKWFSCQYCFNTNDLTGVYC